MTSMYGAFSVQQRRQMKGQWTGRVIIEQAACPGASCLARLPQRQLEGCSPQIYLDALAVGRVTECDNPKACSLTLLELSGQYPQLPLDLIH